MKNRRYRSLRVKFAIIAVVLIGVALVLQILANTYIAPQLYYKMKKTAMTQAYEELKVAANVSEIKYMDVIQRYEDKDNLRFRTKNEASNFGYRTTYEWTKKMQDETVSAENIVMKYENYSAEPQVKIKENKNQKVTIFLKGFIDTDDGRYYVDIRVSPKALSPVLRIVNQFAVFLFGIILIILAVGVYIYMKKIVDPLEIIGNATTKIAAHDFGIELPKRKSQRDEIDILAKNVKVMAEQLETDMQELEMKNKALEAEIRYRDKMDKVRKEFVSNVSHELKTPIAIISGYVQMLKYEKENIDVDYYCDILLEETDTMGEKVEQLLKLSYIEFGLEKLEREVVDLKTLIEQQFAKSQVLFKQKDLVVSMSLSECELMGGKAYLESVVDNFLSNAFKYTELGGTVQITLRCTTKEAQILFYNDAKPFTEEQKENIWESFYQVDQSHNKDGGVGLGLCISKKIIEQHGGTCGVENKEHGVEFYVHLPLDSRREDSLEQL